MCRLPVRFAASKWARALAAQGALNKRRVYQFGSCLAIEKQGAAPVCTATSRVMETASPAIEQG